MRHRNSRHRELFTTFTSQLPYLTLRIYRRSHDQNKMADEVYDGAIGIDLGRVAWNSIPNIRANTTKAQPTHVSPTTRVLALKLVGISFR